MVPLLTEQFVLEDIFVSVIPEGELNDIEELIVQLFKSVTVNEYVPDESPLISSRALPLLQE